MGTAVMAGNVFIGDARPSEYEQNPIVIPGFDPEIKIVEEDMNIFLHLSVDHSFNTDNNVLVTTDTFGKTAISGLPFLNYDAKPLKIDVDYFGIKEMKQILFQVNLKNLKTAETELKFGQLIIGWNN